MATKEIKLLISILILILFTSCETNLKSPYVDNLKQGDTLTLTARFAECGEWGGHTEKVLVFKKGNDLWATFYKDTVFCPMPSTKRIIEKSKELTTTDKNQIIKYIDIFLTARKKEQKPMSNAWCYFDIINKDARLEFYDYKEEWMEYVIMRKAIFDQ